MTQLTPEEKKSHLNKTNCYICREKFRDDNDINQHKVRDYCHYTSKYRGTTHSICNLQSTKYKAPRGIVVVFHNESSNYY